MKKFLALVMAGVLALGMVGCGAKTEEAPAKVEPVTNEAGKKVVTVWHRTGTPSEADYYNRLVEEFNASQEDIQVEAIALPDNSIQEQVNASIMSGDLPDVLDVDGPQMAGYVNSGALAPLDQYMSDELKEDLLPSLIAQGTYDDGKVYILGQFESGLSFWANKSYLEKADVRIPSLDNPWDQAEFMEALGKLKALEEVTYPLDVKVNYGAGYWVYSYLPIVAGFGGDYFNGETFEAQGAMNGPESVKAFEMVKELVDKEYVDPNQSTDDDFYGSKTAALSLVGHWMYPNHTAAQGLGDDAILIPFPNFGNGVFTGNGSWAWGVTTEAAKRGVEAEAYKFVEFMLSKEAVGEIFEVNGAVPGRISVLNEIDEYKEGGRLYLYRQQLVENKAKVRPITPAFGVIQSVIGDAAMNILKGSDVQEELDKAAIEIDQTIEDNGYHGK